MNSISARDANRHFSRLLREVASGKVVTVLSRGKPIATISPAEAHDGEREDAKLALLSRLRKQRSGGARNWTRDELYED